MAGDGLAAFYAARLDELEAAAKAVEDHSEPWAGQWEADGNYGVRTHNGHVLVYGHDRDLKPGLAAHIALNDPASALADVEADRKLLAALRAARGFPGRHEGLLLAVKIRTERFSGHPGYRPEWKP